LHAEESWLSLGMEGTSRPKVHARGCDVDPVAAAAIIMAEFVSERPSRSENVTYPIRINARNNGVSFFAFSHRIMIHAQFLGNQVHNPSLLGTQSPRKRQLVPHAIVFEQQDARIDLQCRRIIKIQLSRQ